MILGTDSRRLGIFFFYDGEGIVDRYVEVMLEGMKTQLAELVVVVNGKLTDQGRVALTRYADHLLVRENRGLDAWAYKAALDHYGWSALTQFDEIVLFNATIMGPVYPFEEMFSEMAGRDLDFWGPTWFHAAPSEYRGEIDELHHPRHLQSHFHVYRRSLVQSQAFQDYWDNLPEMETYLDSVTKHEIPFTRYFQDRGFKAEAYVNTDDLEGFTYQPIVFAPVTLIKDKRCPIFKRRSFFHDYGDVLDQSVGTTTRELYDYLRDHTDFDTDLIWENLLRTNNLADLVKNLELTYILPTQAVAVQPEESKIALVMHVYHMDLLPQLLHYAASMPAGCDLIATVDTEAKAQQVREATAGLSLNVETILIENRGRDVAALLVVLAHACWTMTSSASSMTRRSRRSAPVPSVRASRSAASRTSWQRQSSSPTSSLPSRLSPGWVFSPLRLPTTGTTSRSRPLAGAPMTRTPKSSWRPSGCTLPSIRTRRRLLRSAQFSGSARRPFDHSWSVNGDMTTSRQSHFLLTVRSATPLSVCTATWHRLGATTPAGSSPTRLPALSSQPWRITRILSHER